MKRVAWGLFATEFAVAFVRACVRKNGYPFLLLLLAAVSFNLYAQQPAEHDKPPVIVFDRAQFLQNPSAEPPAAKAPWTVVSLPDSWHLKGRPITNYGWYRLTFEHRGGNHDGNELRQRALYIPRITNNVEIFLNRHSLGMSGRLGPVPQESWNLAQFFYLPTSGFRDGENEILIRLHPQSNYGRPGISAIQLGETEAVRSRYVRRYFIQTTAPQLISWVLGVMAIFSFWIWLRRRTETLGFLFGCMALAAIVRTFHHYLRDLEPWMRTLDVPAVVWLSALQIRVALHFADRQMPRTERGLMSFAISTTIIWYAAGLAGYWQVTAGLIYLVLAVMAPVMILVLIVRLSNELKTENVIMILAMILNSALGIHDFFNFQEALGFDRMYLLPLGLPFIMFAMASMLVRRFVSTLARYEALTADQAVRLDRRQQQLTASYQQLRSADQQRLMAEERQRLMRDMHDGIGSHLMSTLALARMGKLSAQQMTDVLTDSIDELKITIDSLEPVERDLLVVLGNLRYRLEPRLNAAGITLEWAVKDLPPLDYLDPENVRSVLRIVQEAFTNILKHADATHITLATSVNYPKNEVVVRVSDDGKGLNGDERAGRGLENMRSRAEKIKGRVDIGANPSGGTVVELRMPIMLPD